MSARATAGARPHGTVPATGTARTAGFVCLTGALLVVAFWVLYCAGPLAPSEDDLLVRSFESAFPVADGVLALTLAGAGAALLEGRRAGPFLLSVGAAMCLYLGLLDATFYGLRGLNTPFTAAGRIELVINVLCVGGGLWGLRLGWRFGNCPIRPAPTGTDGALPPENPAPFVGRTP